MRLTATAFLSESRRRVIDERVTHRERRGPQKVRLICKTAGFAQAQIGLVHQGRGLQGVVATQARPSPLRHLLQLVIKRRQ